MLEVLLVLLVVLWFLGYINIPGLPIPNIALFTINGHIITLWSLLIFILVLWAVSILPSPFSEIGYILVILWVMATLGILAITGLPALLMIAIIAGIIVAYLQGPTTHTHKG